MRALTHQLPSTQQGRSASGSGNNQWTWTRTGTRRSRRHHRVDADVGWVGLLQEYSCTRHEMNTLTLRHACAESSTLHYKGVWNTFITACAPLDNDTGNLTGQSNPWRTHHIVPLLYLVPLLLLVTPLPPPFFLLLRLPLPCNPCTCS